MINNYQSISDKKNSEEFYFQMQNSKINVNLKVLEYYLAINKLKY